MFYNGFKNNDLFLVIHLKLPYKTCDAYLFRIVLIITQRITPMEYLKINYEEVSALRGLPHMQQLLYLCGIKPFVDYRTGIIGIKRKISYQSLSEVLYVEPHSGIQSGSPSKSQLRRALKGLERAGVINIQSDDYSLILQCLFVSTGHSV